MREQFVRLEKILGDDGIRKLFESRVAVFGAGGVGGYCIEALARSGVGAIDVVDNDRVELSNLNRQILATHKTVGKFKAEVAAERILEINPECKVTAHRLFYLPETENEIALGAFDYIVDAIDTVAGKIALAVNAKKHGVPIISCMGTGNKLNAFALEVADIYSTSVCPLARVMRRELKKRGVDSLKVVYSKEEPLTPLPEPDFDENAMGTRERPRRSSPASTAFVPAVAGLIAAGEVVKDLCLKNL